METLICMTNVIDKKNELRKVLITLPQNGGKENNSEIQTHIHEDTTPLLGPLNVGLFKPEKKKNFYFYIK